MKLGFSHLFVLSITIFLTGCLPATPTPDSLSSCSPSALVAPALTSPTMWQVVDTLTPTLSWTSSDPSVPYPYDDCAPFGYRIQLRSGPFFSFDLGTTSYGPAIRNWTPTTPLLPGTGYEWAVAAFTSGNGPYGGSNYFFTGPICDTDSLVAPTLLSPTNGSINNALRPLLVWDYPEDCIPQGYRVDLSTDASFSDTSLSGGTGNPSTRWTTGADLTDCTWYYWRIAPGNGTTLGPYSITRNFMVNATGSCLYPIPELPLVITVIPFVTEPPPLLPMFTLSQNGNCRFGPSQVYEIRTSYLAGEILSIEGKNLDGSWLYARMPGNGNNFCWLSIVTGQFNLDISVLPVIEAPPTPVPTLQQPNYSSCKDYTTQAVCKADPKNFGCEWSPNNVCVSK